MSVDPVPSELTAAAPRPLVGVLQPKAALLVWILMIAAPPVTVLLTYFTMPDSQPRWAIAALATVLVEAVALRLWWAAKRLQRICSVGKLVWWEIVPSISGREEDKQSLTVQITRDDGSTCAGAIRGFPKGFRADPAGLGQQESSAGDFSAFAGKLPVLVDAADPKHFAMLFPKLGMFLGRLG